MQKKKYWMVFGAVVVVILTVSSASALPLLQSNKSEKGKNTVCVDSNIYLTRKNLPLLEATLKENQNPDVHTIIQGCILGIKEKGWIDGTNIREIVIKNKLNVQDIHTGFIYCSGRGDVNYLPVRFIKWILQTGIFCYQIRRGPILIFKGELLGGTMKINFAYTYNGNYKITVIGFLGTAGDSDEVDELGPYIYILGLALLIIVSN